MDDTKPTLAVRLEDGERRGRYVATVAGIDAEAEWRDVFTVGPGRMP